MVGAVTIETLTRLSARTLKRELEKQEKNFKFSAAIAMTKTAKIAQANVIEALPRYIDRPTRWTLRGTYIVPAKPKKLETKVAFKDDRAIGNRGNSKGGTAAANYMIWQTEGGQRQQKGIERKLVALGILGRDEYVVPGDAQRLNRYGNIPRARLSKMLADIQGANVGIAQGFGQATTKTGKKKFFYHPNLRPRGIWERFGRGGRRARPALLFVKKSFYRRRFPFDKIVNDTFEKHLDDEFEKQFTSSRR